MPGGDRTGPAGMGPMTGWAAGYCAGYQVPRFMNPVWVRGRGAGYGWGRGGRGGWRHRHWYYATGLPGWQRAGMVWPAYPSVFPGPFGPIITKEQELEGLKKQAEYFERALDNLKNRIREVEPPHEGEEAT
jgi:hypothetical protein